jgi:hypothetical protein
VQHATALQFLALGNASGKKERIVEGASSKKERIVEGCEKKH